MYMSATCVFVCSCSAQVYAALETMAYKRLVSLKDQEKLLAITKLYITEPPSQSVGDWFCDPALVCSNYENFLVSVAKTGHRLDSIVFPKVLKEVFECDVQSLAKFAKALTAALAYARSKCTQVSSGLKTSKAVLKIVQAYNDQDPSRDAEGSPTDLHAVETACILDAADLESAGAHDAASSSLDEAKKLFPAARPRPLQRVVSIASSGGSPAKKSEEEKTCEVGTSIVMHVVE